MPRKIGNTIRSAPKRKKRKDRKALTQENTKSYKGRSNKEPSENTKPPKSQKERVARQRNDKATERKDDLRDGEDKARITESPQFKPGIWTKKFLREQETRVDPTVTYQDRVLAKAVKKKELRPLPKDPAEIRKLVTSSQFKPAPRESDLAKRYIPPSAPSE